MSDYDFIINNKPQRNGMGFGAGRMRSKLMMLIGGVIILIIIIIVFSSLLNSGKPSATSYIPIAVYQEELLRILENKDELTNQATLAQYSTLHLAITSDLQASTDYLTKNGLKITPEQRSPYYYFDLESDLETASSANRFDAELASYVEKAIADYSQALVSLEPTTGQKPLVEQAKQNIIFYNGRSTTQE